MLTRVTILPVLLMMLGTAAANAGIGDAIW